MDISDIARIAGVSPSTVSKVINHKDASISSQTRERVLKVVREYHYVPHARSRATRDWLVGVLFRSPISLDSTLDGILSAAQSRGYATLVFNSDSDPEQEKKNLAALKSSGAAGIIWEPVNMESLSERAGLEADDTKVITIGPNGGDRSLLLPYEKASYNVTMELVSRGHTRIGCLVSEGRRTPDFIHGFRRCLFENGMAFQESMVFTEVGEALLSKVGTGEVTGIVCSHYQMASALYSRLASLHYHAPDDFSIVSLRNDSGSSWTESADGDISTYTIRNSDFGRLACERLIRKMEGGAVESSFFQSLTLDNDNSLGAPPRRRSQRVVVVGSINIDMRLSVPVLPSSGITVSTERSLTYTGGKGANQAAGVARLGHRVTLIGDVGADSASDHVYQQLEGWDVDTSGVYRKAGEETGKAFIFVNPEGESMITVLSGANASLHAADIYAREGLFEGARCCLVQSEIPMDAVEAACRVAHRHGAMTILKPAACDRLPDEVVREVDVLVPNQHELDAICPEGKTVEEKAQLLLDRGAGLVVVTLGADGCYLHGPRQQQHFPAAEFSSVDSTGAGDAFISALASCLLNGDDLDACMSKANYAAGYSTTRRGVASALIDRYALECEFREA